MESVLPLLAFVFISTITPGPNNFLLAASGLRFGVFRTLPHVLGIHLGVYTLVILCGFGLGQALMAVPSLVLGLKLFATGYLCYLAWKILGFEVQHDEAEENVHSPMRIHEAGLFQFSNPKAWMMATTGINFALTAVGDPATGVEPGQSGLWLAILLLCVSFATLGAGCNLLWVWLGSSLRQALAKPASRRWINGGLAVMTVTTVAAFWVS